MCRSIKKLRRPEQKPSQQEIQEAALQFIRKISGYREPSNKNREAFDQAVVEVAEVAKKLFTNLS